MLPRIRKLLALLPRESAEALPPICSKDVLPNISPKPLIQPCDPQQLKRWAVLDNFVDYEKNYLLSLMFVSMDCYFAGLDPNTLRPTVSTELFEYMKELQRLHKRFYKMLAAVTKQWTGLEMVGHVFLALLEQPVLVQLYASYVTNYARMLSLAREDMRRNVVFRDLIEEKIRRMGWRMYFEQLLVKPVQRMIHFELQLGEMVKMTPADHPDQPLLQQCGHRLKYILSKMNDLEGKYELLRETLEVTFPRTLWKGWVASQINQRHLLCSQKCYSSWEHPFNLTNDRIVLLGDRVVFGSDPKPATKHFLPQKPKLKWFLSLKSISFYTDQNSGASETYLKMVHLFSDWKTLADMVVKAGNLFNLYDTFNAEEIQFLKLRCETNMQTINQQCMDAAEAYYSNSFKLEKHATTAGRSREEPKFIFFPNAVAKRRWHDNARLAQRVVQPQSHMLLVYPEPYMISTPVFVDKLKLGEEGECVQISCGCYYAPNLDAPLYQALPFKDWLTSYNTLWMCSINRNNTLVTLYSHNLISNNINFRMKFTIKKTIVTCVVQVPEGQVVPNCPETIHTVWMGAKNKLLIYSATVPLENFLTTIPIDGTALHIIHQKNRVYVGLDNGVVLIYKKNPDWNIYKPVIVKLSTNRISGLLAIKGTVYVAVFSELYAIDAETDEVKNIGEAISEKKERGPIIAMAYSINGLWLARKGSSNISLWSLSPWQQLEDIDVTKSVRNFSLLFNMIKGRNISVTSIMVIDDSLWIGTSVGVTLMLDLPLRRNVPVLQEFLVPVKKGHSGSVTFLLPLKIATLPDVHAIDEVEQVDFEALEEKFQDLRATSTGTSALDIYDNLQDTTEGAAATEQPSNSDEINTTDEATPPEEHTLTDARCTNRDFLDNKIPVTVMVLAGGKGHTNWNLVDTAAESTLDDDAHLCVWEKRTSFYK